MVANGNATAQHYNFDTVKSDYPIEVYVENWLGEPEAGKRGNNLKWCCPFHTEDTPSFSVNVRRQTWHCFGSCDCGGDIFDLVQMRVNGCIVKTPEAARAAYDELTGQPAPVFDPAMRRKPKAAVKVEPPSEADVFEWSLNVAPTMDYFAGRGISKQTINERRFGCDLDAEGNYPCQNGQWINLRHRRYTIPYYSGRVLKTWTKRRDDADCMGLMYDAHLGALKIIRADIATRKKIDVSRVTEKMLLDRMYGPKYLKHGGGGFPVYNINRLYRLDEAGDLVMHDGLPVLMALDDVMLVEGEVDAQSTEDAGYFAVSYNRNARTNWKWLFSRVRRPIIVADNDDAGEKHAQDMARLIDNPGTIIVYPEDGCKDNNDMVRSGLIERWAERYGITPDLPVRWQREA